MSNVGHMYTTADVTVTLAIWSEEHAMALQNRGKNIPILTLDVTSRYWKSRRDRTQI